MCGIAGAFGGLSDAECRSIADRVVKAIRYRGPDADGFQQFENGFFVHLRLSIIDLSPGGAQPKWSADGRYCISYNGEIYNYKELRADLQKLGHAFTTDSDTEVLVKVWQAWGAEGLKRCIGMYAFALYDAEKKQVHFARDPYGIKPLYIARTQAGIRFGSTYSALDCFPDCPRKINAKRAFEFIRHGLIELRGDTLVQDVRSLEPGMVETWDVAPGGIRRVAAQVLIRPSYEPRHEETFAQAAERLRVSFLQSVRLHLRSDVPLGFSLSGGLDSAAVVCAARVLEPDAELRTFTYVGENGAIDESGWAKIVSDHVGAVPHIVRIPSDSAAHALEDMVQAYGTPPSSASTRAHYAVFDAAHRSGVTVMLDGQGADELFGGYQFYRGAAVAGCLKRGDLVGAVRFLTNGDDPRHSAISMFGWALEHLLPLGAQRVIRRVAGYEFLPDWVDRDWVEDHAGASIDTMGYRVNMFGRDVLGERLAYDLTEFIIPSILTNDDRNSMAHSVESRVPFLAQPVSDVALSVPSHFHLGPNTPTKNLLREALRGLVPEPILQRRDKVAFEAPDGAWLMADAERIERLLDSDEARAIRLFKHDRLMARWTALKSNPSSTEFQYVWRWIGLIMWTRMFRIVWN